MNLQRLLPQRSEEKVLKHSLFQCFTDPKTLQTFGRCRKSLKFDLDKAKTKIRKRRVSGRKGTVGRGNKGEKDAHKMLSEVSQNGHVTVCL